FRRQKTATQSPQSHHQNTTISPQITIQKTQQIPQPPCIYRVSTTLTNTREYSPPQSSDSPSPAAAASATAPAGYAAHSPTSAALPAPAAAPPPYVPDSSPQAPECSPSAD